MSTTTAVSRLNGELATVEQPQRVQIQAGGATSGFVERLEEYWRLAKLLVASGMIKQKTPEAAMAILLQAHELAIPAMTAFRSIHFFDGNLVVAASLMGAMATDRCGVTWSVEEWTDTTCRLVMHRPNWQPIPVEWTIEDAKRANLVGKSNWKSYPRAMLFNRALAQGVRAIAPDHFVGVYDQDELGADVNEVRAASVGRTAVDEMNERLLSAPAAETEDTDEPQGSLV